MVTSSSVTRVLQRHGSIHVIGVSSDNAMTATWYPMPYDVLETLSNRIINEVDGINRVVYDISSKPPATIEWE